MVKFNMIKYFILGLQRAKGIGVQTINTILSLHSKYSDNFFNILIILERELNESAEKHLSTIKNLLKKYEYFINLGKELNEELKRENIHFFLKNELPDRFKFAEWLFIQGDIDKFKNNNKYIGIIGSREPHGDYEILLRQLIKILKKINPVIVSGLARGIDIAVHKISLEEKLPTISILGYGIKYVYSSSDEYRFLRDSIPKEGGLIISSYKLNDFPSRERFLNRNNGIAYLSDILIPIQCSVPSGTYSTVLKALNLRKNILIIPNPYVKDLHKFFEKKKYENFYSFNIDELSEHEILKLISKNGTINKDLEADSLKTNKDKTDIKNFALF